ncbi:hypothetical protein ACJJTC_006342 [Scirpophaga incertulas]
MEEKVESEQSVSGESSTSSSGSTSGSSDSDDEVMEPVRIMGNTLELPQDLCENYTIFKEFFSMKTWESLEDKHKEKLIKHLPKFSGNEAEEREKTIKMLFNHEPFHFTSPLSVLYNNLKQGNYRPDIAKMRKFLKKARVKQQRHKVKTYYARLLPEVLVSRERLLAAAKAAPPGPVPRLALIPPKPSSKNNYKPLYVRAKQRYFEELAAIRSEVGGEQSDDENYPDGPPENPLKKRKQANISNNMDINVLGTLGGSDGSHPTSMECLKNILTTHRQRRQYRENHPELNTTSITLEDIKQRVALVNGSTKKLMFGSQKSENSIQKHKRSTKKDSQKSKLQEPKTSVKKNKDDQHEQAENNPLLPNIKIKCEQEESESENSCYIDPAASPMSNSKKLLDDTEIKQEDDPKHAVVNHHSTDSKLEHTIKQEPPDPTIPIQNNSRAAHQPVPIKLEDLDGIDMMALPIELANDSGEVIAVDGEVVEADESLTETTHASFLSLVRALFPARAAHRASKHQLRKRCAAVMKSPIAPLNTWYSLSDDWSAELDSALDFLAGERGPHPDDFVPYLQFVPESQMYQWIGAGRDCDAILGRLCERWLRSVSPAPPAVDPPPPRYPTSWVMRAPKSSEIAEFRAQERQRFAAAAKPFTYIQHGMSQWIGSCNDQALLGALSSALERLQAAKRDPVVKYDHRTAVWTYLHRNRSEEDWLKTTGRRGRTARAMIRGTPPPPPPPKPNVEPQTIKTDEKPENASDSDVDIEDTSASSSVSHLSSAQLLMQATQATQGKQPPNPPIIKSKGKLVPTPPKIKTNIQIKQVKPNLMTQSVKQANLLSQAAKQASLMSQAVKQANLLSQAAKQNAVATKQVQSVQIKQNSGTIVTKNNLPPQLKSSSVTIQKPSNTSVIKQTVVKPVNIQTKQVSVAKAPAVPVQTGAKQTTPVQTQKQTQLKSNVPAQSQGNAQIVAQVPKTAPPIIATPHKSPLIKQRPLLRTETTQGTSVTVPSSSTLPTAVTVLPTIAPALSTVQNKLVQGTRSLLIRPPTIQTTVMAAVSSPATQAAATPRRGVVRVLSPAAPSGKSLISPRALMQTSITTVTTKKRVTVPNTMSVTTIAQSTAGATAVVSSVPTVVTTAVSTRTVQLAGGRTVQLAANQTVHLPGGQAVQLSGHTLQLSSLQLPTHSVRLPSGQTVQLASPQAMQAVRAVSSAMVKTASPRIHQTSSTVKTIQTSQTTVPIPVSTVQLSGQTVQIAGQTVQLAGQSVQLTGHTVKLPSGQSVQVASQSVIPTQSVQLPSGQTVQLASGVQTVQLGSSIQIPSSQSVQMPSGQSVQLGAQTVQLAGQTVQIAGGQTVQLPNGQTVQLPSGQTLQLPGGQTVQLSSGQTLQLSSGQTVQLTNPSTQKAMSQVVRSQTTTEKTTQPIVAKLLTNAQAARRGEGAGADAAGAAGRRAPAAQRHPTAAASGRSQAARRGEGAGADAAGAAGRRAPAAQRHPTAAASGRSQAARRGEGAGADAAGAAGRRAPAAQRHPTAAASGRSQAARRGEGAGADAAGAAGRRAPAAQRHPTAAASGRSQAARRGEGAGADAAGAAGRRAPAAQRHPTAAASGRSQAARRGEGAGADAAGAAGRRAPAAQRHPTAAASGRSQAARRGEGAGADAAGAAGRRAPAAQRHPTAAASGRSQAARRGEGAGADAAGAAGRRAPAAQRHPTAAASGRSQAARRGEGAGADAAGAAGRRAPAAQRHPTGTIMSPHNCSSCKRPQPGRRGR